MGNIREATSEEEPAAVQKARVARYWGTYQRVQELWRMGEKLSLNRWGKTVDSSQLSVVSEEEQAMRQLCQGLEALLVGFE